MADRISVARDAILDELKRRFQAGDKDVQPNDADYHWYKPQKNYYSGAGRMQCPVCNTGTLQYSRSGHNGHVLGRCSTNGCVAWME